MAEPEPSEHLVSAEVTMKSLHDLVDRLNREHRVTVYLAPNIDRDWVASQLPSWVEVATHEYLREGALVVYPTRKVFHLPIADQAISTETPLQAPESPASGSGPPE